MSVQCVRGGVLTRVVQCLCVCGLALGHRCVWSRRCLSVWSSSGVRWDTCVGIGEVVSLWGYVYVCVVWVLGRGVVPVGAVFSVVSWSCVEESCGGERGGCVFGSRVLCVGSGGFVRTGSWGVEGSCCGVFVGCCDVRGVVGVARGLDVMVRGVW